MENIFNGPHLCFQVFNIIIQMLSSTDFGMTIKTTGATIQVQITKKVKLQYLLRQASEVNYLECYSRAGDRAMVVVSPVKPFCMKYSKNKERLVIKIEYEWYNKYGVRQ